MNESGTFGTYEADDFHLVFKKPPCSDENWFFYLDPLQDPRDYFYISETGYLMNGTGSIMFEPGTFCLEVFSTNFQIIPSICDLAPFDPVPTEPMVIGHRIIWINIIGMILSLPFLIVTFIVYALLEELRNCQGKSLMCYIASIVVAYISFITNQLYTTTIQGKSNLCITLGK